MIRMFLIFTFITGLIALGITLFRELSEKERWTTVKVVGFAMMCSLLTCVLLAFIVILF
jgi:hypothetical protein